MMMNYIVSKRSTNITICKTLRTIKLKRTRDSRPSGNAVYKFLRTLPHHFAIILRNALEVFSNFRL